MKTGIKIPRLMIAAASSGSGKTIISCSLMQALKDKQYKVAAQKCGPDYIDPMFHRQVLGIEVQNLDLFFCQTSTLEELFAEHTKDADITVIEGVMGYYDGMTLDSEQASSYDVARTLKTPVILIVTCKGMALSVLAILKGMITFREDSHIQGILLNRMSPILYPKMKKMIQEGLAKMGLSIPVVGYVPESDLFHLKSRHLGLVTPNEIQNLQEQLEAAGLLLAQTVDLNMLIEIANQSPDLMKKPEPKAPKKPIVRLGIARDDAFAFYYKDNLRLLEILGCELVEFSPISDKKLPSGLGGILLGGGYPELYAKQLSENEEFCRSLREALNSGLPCLAECGGFMYLHKWMEGADGRRYRMIGAIAGQTVRQKRLVRFGYVNISGTTKGEYLHTGEIIRGHEFHYWDSSNNGEDCTASKPDGSRSWKCIHMSGSLFAGYPHLHYYSNPEFAKRFVKRAFDYIGRNEE